MAEQYGWCLHLELCGTHRLQLLPPQACEAQLRHTPAAQALLGPSTGSGCWSRPASCTALLDQQLPWHLLLNHGSGLQCTVHS